MANENEILKRSEQGQTELGISAIEVAAILQTGRTFFDQGRFADAKNMFEGLSVLDGRNPYVHGILGAIYQKEEKYDVALFHYDRALELYPEDTSSLTNRGEIHLKLGRFEEAAADFKKAIDLDEKQRNSASNRSRLLVALTLEVLELAKQQGLNAVLKTPEQAGHQIRKSN